AISPSETPRPAPRGHATRLSAGLRTRGRGRRRLPPNPSLPKAEAPVSNDGFVSTYRCGGSAGFGPFRRRTGFPFHPEARGRRNRRGTTYRGVTVRSTRHAVEQKRPAVEHAA